MSKTFTIIKPNATIDNNIGEIIAIIERNEFEIGNMEMLTLTRNQAESFYSEHKTKSFFTKLVDFMISAPIIVMELRKHNAVSDFRKLIGNTNPSIAEKGTIRSLFGKDVRENAIHGSDSDTNAQKEIDFFF
jgi:nucleoside-diphosphate kinase